MNPKDTLVNQGVDGYTSDDSWSQYRPTTKSGIKKFEAFKRALQARRAQQVQKQQQNQESFLLVAKYWATSINNAKTVHDILSIQQGMSTMEATVTLFEHLITLGMLLAPPNFPLMKKIMTLMMTEQKLK